ncbi:MAG TPA: methyl-accepting chemotaxis protein [Patescibacteria group bacterium]|nr:methyl-accepting chemotaxis protein [Patescibacteria group bacterium]
MENWFANLKMAHKQGVLILIAALALCAVGFMGYFYLRQANEAMDLLYDERLIPVKMLTENRSYARGINGAILELMLTTDDKRNKELKDYIDDRTKMATNNLTQVGKMKLDTNAAQQLANTLTLQLQYREARTQVIELAMQNKNAEAYVLYTAQVAELANQYTDALRDLGNYFAKLSEQANQENAVLFDRAIKFTLAIIVGAVCVIILTGWLITRAITRPLRQSVHTCKTLAAGDFRDNGQQMDRRDEVGQMVVALDTVRGNLQLLLQKIVESAEQVAASSEELTASAEQSSQATQQIATAITEVAEGAGKQLAASDDAARAVRNMSDSLEMVAENSNQVAAHSAQAADKAQVGGQAVAKAVSQIGQIEHTVNRSAEVVIKLGERSKEIGQIVDTISGIAGQTNLLALNAAIEAARAGEQGRGFAVVAEEVRKLAEQSQEAAKKIAQLIEEIQRDTDQAVTAMSNGTREVKIGAEVVNAAGLAFGEIAQLVLQVSGQVQESTAAFKELSGNSQKIVGSVQSIERLSKNTAGESQSVSAAAQEQLASIEEIASASEALAKLSQELQTEVAKFRI